ncbi:SUKH-3 domain-containing protein [Planctomicrobium piriforme]|uniref:SUKH-3 immunity protein n=1 Tax=Planctomicrobium piriforme TaxID=1576369 RepID=A0A1I3M0D2_9PLAN|nr:SUKH-3 domain-containing protein [Planctomicrobium piriforme]SFI90479.1 SUKH-3 immunity protein [Planctomicrobium piriforme]
MSADNFTKRTEKCLRAAGWHSGRKISLKNFGRVYESSHAAGELLQEFGQLTLSPTNQQIFAFGPMFQVGVESDLAERMLSSDDVAVASIVWAHVGESLGEDICNIAWEQLEDLHAIGIDSMGRIYCATWCDFTCPGKVDVDVLKLADSIVAYLNYWLDPGIATRTHLHGRWSAWSESLMLPVT